MKRWMIYARWIKKNLSFTVQTVEANTQEEALRIFRSRDFCLHADLFQLYAIPETSFSQEPAPFVQTSLCVPATSISAESKCATAQAA
jgi:hypothetical protein